MPLATWNGPYDALLVNGGILRVGDTRDVTDQDIASSYWQPVETTDASQPFSVPDAPVLEPDPAPEA